GEVHQRARAETEQWLTGRVTIFQVLRDGSAQLLLEERLQLTRGHGQAVDEEDEVDRPFVASLRRQEHLPSHTQPHLLVLLGHCLVQRRCRLELTHPEMSSRPTGV